MTQICSPMDEDRAEWVRMRRALWPDCPMILALRSQGPDDGRVTLDARGRVRNG